MKQLLSIISVVVLSSVVCAQPSEAEIKKQISNAGTKSITFTKSTGTRQWNRDIGNWEWVRGVEVRRSSEYPGIDLLVVGDVVYQYTGTGKYSYWKFRTLSNQYFGIPNPTAKEINDFISTDWRKFYGYYYTTITKLWSAPVLAEDPRWTWHNPNSVEFRMKLKFDHIIRGKGIETAERIWIVRFYRDNPKDTWKRMITQWSEEASDINIIGMKNYTPQQLQDLEKQTLVFTQNEKPAQSNAAALTSGIHVPEFTNAEDMVRFVHNILRNGNPDQLKAVALKLFAPGFFVEGSKVQLSVREEQNLDNVITAAYNNKVTYKQLYCQEPGYRVDKWADGRRSIYISSAVNNCNSQITVGPVNMGYVEGVPQTKLMILEYGIYVRQDQDALSYVNSFTDRKKMCPKD